MFLVTLMLSALAAAPSETPASAQVGELLAMRHDPGCGAIRAVGPSGDVRDALVAATATPMPPWAPIRAASCLAEFAATDDIAWEAVRDLIGRPDQPGFVLAVLERTDALPADRALHVARVGLERARVEPALLRAVPSRVARSEHEIVRAEGLRFQAAPAAD
jgi:hypothetical protein